MKKVVLLFASGICAALAFQAKKPIDYVNALVGTAPLDAPKLIGNAPPPGEELYTGMTSPGAVLPHGVIDLSPVNKNLDLAYRRGRGHVLQLHCTAPCSALPARIQGMMVMPVVGDWTVPPERSASYYSKDKEKAAAGYYTVYLDDYRVKVELTAGAWTGMYRFTFPKSERSHVLMDLSRAGGSVEVWATTPFVAARSAPCAARYPALRSAARRGPASWPSFRSRSPVLAPSIRTLPPEPAAARILGGNSVSPGSRTDSGNYAGVYLDFATSEGERVLVKIAAGDSYETAQRYLEEESPGWNFDGMQKRAGGSLGGQAEPHRSEGRDRKRAHAVLLQPLPLVRQPAADRAQRRAVAAPSMESRAPPITTVMAPCPSGIPGATRSCCSTLVEPAVKVDILRSTLEQARETGFMQTSFHGDHAVWMYLGDWLRGIPVRLPGGVRVPLQERYHHKPWRASLSRRVPSEWVHFRLHPERQPQPSLCGRQGGRGHDAGVCLGRRLACRLRQKAWARKTTTRCSGSELTTTAMYSTPRWGSCAAGQATANGFRPLIPRSLTTIS